MNKQKALKRSSKGIEKKTARREIHTDKSMKINAPAQGAEGHGDGHLKFSTRSREVARTVKDDHDVFSLLRDKTVAREEANMGHSAIGGERLQRDDTTKARRYILRASRRREKHF